MFFVFLPGGRGGGTEKKVGGLTLPLNDCTEAGVQGLHSEEFFSPLASEKVVWLSPPTPQSGGAKAPSAPPAPPPLPGGISKEWHQIVSPNCDFEGETGPIVPMFTGLSGKTWETAKIAHESHNDVRRL